MISSVEIASIEIVSIEVFLLNGSLTKAIKSEEITLINYYTCERLRKSFIWSLKAFTTRRKISVLVTQWDGKLRGSLNNARVYLADVASLAISNIIELNIE